METAKDMYKVYSKTPTAQLITNKHRKMVELYRLRDESGYWAVKDRARLRHLIMQIDAVIEARKLQTPLL
jgi:hypothetical protein